MKDSAWRNGESTAPKLDFETLAAMVKDCPFHEWLGVELVSLDATGIAIRMPWRAEFVSDPDRGYAHGGVLASLIDLAADYAVAARLGYSTKGLEPDEKAVELCRQQGFDVDLGGLPDTGQKGKSFDHVTLSHVLEHLHDPAAALQSSNPLHCLRSRVPISASGTFHVSVVHEY